MSIDLQSFNKLYCVLTLEYEKLYKVKGYRDYGIGFQSNIYNNFGYTLELQKYDAFNSLENIAAYQFEVLGASIINISSSVLSDAAGFTYFIRKEIRS